MEFSIIIPTYNEEGYIKHCLDSILRLDYPRDKFEIIVSDANSSDKTIEIALNLADKIISDGRRGISYGRNLGAAKAIGDILIFIDADATLANDFLKQVHQIFSNKKVVGMTGIAVPSDGEILQKLVYRITYILVGIFKYIGLSLFPGVCIAYRRDTFLLINGFREDFGIVEDLDLSKRISKIGECVVNNKARAFVSTRRLKKDLVSTVIFHVYCDLRYLITGRAPSFYPKVEEIHSWRDLWK